MITCLSEMHYDLLPQLAREFTDSRDLNERLLALYQVCLLAFLLPLLENLTAEIPSSFSEALVPQRDVFCYGSFERYVCVDGWAGCTVQKLLVPSHVQSVFTSKLRRCWTRTGRAV